MPRLVIPFMPPTLANEIELSRQGFSGHGLRRIQKLNDTLRRTRALVAESREDATKSLALLIAETRVLVLRMGRHEFGTTAGMHFHAVKNVETPGSHPQHESFSRVYRTWNRLATGDHGQTPKVKKQLSQACAKILDLLVPEEDEYGHPLRATIDGLYRIWRYQSGHDAFDIASRKTNQQRVPLSYGTLWQRREVGMVPDFHEVRVIGTQLGRDLAAASKIWEQCKTEQLLERDVPQPLVRFIVAIQVAYPELRMTGSSIRRHLQVSEKNAQAINNGQLVDFDEIRHVVDAVIPKKEISSLHDAWKAAWDRSDSQEDFAAAFPRICKENGWSNHMLATLLRVRAPEQRSVPPASKKSKNISRIESYRPSAEVRRMYQENSFSGQAPAKAAIDLIAAEDIPEASGESQKDYLSRLFLTGVEGRLSRKGSGAHASPVRRHRIFCGVTPQQLANAAGYSSAAILLMERGIQKVSAAETKRLVQLIETFPARKVSAARTRLAELNSAPTSVRQAAERLKELHGGNIPLSRLLHDESDRRFSFTPARLKRIAVGDEIPALPLLKHLVTTGGTHVTPELVRDWYDRMPSYLTGQGPLRWRHPLARGFGIVIFEKWHSLHHFWEEQFQEDFSYSIVTRNFQQLNGMGYDFPWTTVSRYLNAAGVGVSDPRRTYLQQLFHHKDEITDALNSRNRSAYLTIMGQILKHWRTQIRAANHDPQSIEYTLGLTPAERDARA